MNHKGKTLKWFTNRIGKRVYRDHTPTRCCDACDNVANNGLVITDEQHAWYLHATEQDFGAEGIFLNYRDKK